MAQKIAGEIRVIVRAIDADISAFAPVSSKPELAGNFRPEYPAALELAKNRKPRQGDGNISVGQAWPDVGRNEQNGSL